MTTNQSTQAPQFVPFEKVKEYVDANIPIVPLKANGDPHVYFLYDTKNGEEEKLSNNLSENMKKHVFSGGHVQVLKLLNQQIPNKFWTNERINNQQWYGIGCKTGLTAIPSQADPNKVLLIIAVDADDQKPKIILEKLIKQYSLLENTLVQNTPHGGIHVVFAVIVDPNNFDEVRSWEKKSLGLGLCKNCKIEIKASNQQITLDPSKHRKDGKPYTRISKVIAISEQPMFYDVLIKALKDADCLTETPEEYHERRDKQAQGDSNGTFNTDAERCDLTENEISVCIDIILGRDEENKNENSPFSSIYTVGHRNDVCMSLSGFFYWSHITQSSAEIVIKRIAEETNDGSADVNKAVGNVVAAYKRADSGLPTLGKSGIIEAFKRSHRDNNETLAKQRLVKLQDAINVQRKTPQLTPQEKKEKKLKEPRQSDVIVQLARSHIPLLFKNQFKEYCAIIKVNSWYEVVNLDDQRFSATLRQLWIEENVSKNRPMITTIGEDQLKRAKDTLISDIEHSKTPRITTYLRVAWGPKRDGIATSIRYDLVNDEWQQVEITGSEDGISGFKIINSDIMVKEIKEWKDSKYNPDKAPILFRRYDVNEAQIGPDKNFKSEIFDEFIYQYTNVIGNKSAEMAKRYARHFGTEASLDEDTKVLLAKVDICVKFIPEVSKFVNDIIGSEGSMKTTFLEFVKSLVDPIPGAKLSSPRLPRKEIEHIFAHSYFVCFDNVGELSYDLSNFICAAATGTSVQFRKLYTSQGIIQLVIKCCVAFTSINRSFIQADAVRRLLNYQFLALDDDRSIYVDEEEIRYKFEREIKPKLLACIFSIVSKAILIKPRLKGKFILKSMAAAEEWGEALSQAMGYQDGEFITAYEKLSTIQKSQTLEFNPLVILYQKLYYDTFRPDENVGSDQIIKQGFKSFTFGEIYQLLYDYAEAEGISVLKENKQWPRNNRELRDRTTRISIQLMNARKFSVDVRVDPITNETIYILGTKEGLERYRAEEPIGVKGCALILEQYPDLQVSLEDLATSASKNDIQVSVHFDGKFKLNNSTKMRTLRDDLLKHPNIIQVNDGPISFKWQLEPKKHEFTKDVEQSYGHSVLKNDRFEKINFLATQNILESPTEKNIDQPSKNNFEKSAKINTDRIEDSYNLSQEPVTQPIITTKNQTFEPVPVPKSLLEQVPKLGKLATFDTEWYREDQKENKDKKRDGNIYAFCLTDYQGKNTMLLIDQFNGDRYKLMSAVLDAMESYETLAGFGIFSEGRFVSDLDHIKMNCEKVGLSQRYEEVKSKLEWIDVQKIFSNNTVKTFLKNVGEATYREENLNAVAQAYLGEGKIENVSGANAELLPPNEQLEYCLQDAQLCYKILQKKDFELSQIINEIAQEIKQTFSQTCNAGYPTTWWKAKLDSIRYQKVSPSVQQWIDENMTYNDRMKTKKKTGVKYLGGRVIPPKMGRHLNAVSYDVSSMYPTMADVHNISTETVCCKCCKDDPIAKVPDEVMKDINDYVLDPENKAKKREARPWHYWICRKQRGMLADVMKDLIQRKIQYKESGLKLKEKAMKILMNSGYGSFGNAYFEYQDPRLAELITAFGQYTLKSLEKFVGEENVLYGDTDSIYLVNANENIIADAKDKFGVRLEVDEVWKILFLTGNKKQYVGLTEEGELVHTTMTGMKSNQPLYYNEVAQKLISKEFLEAFIDTSTEIALERIMKYIRSAFAELQLSDNMDKLSFSLESKDALYTHTKNDTQKQIYTEILEDCGNDIQLANSKSEAGRVYRYWKIKARNRKVTIHPEKYELDTQKYKEGLFNCIKPVLEVYGMTNDDISQLYNELVNNAQMMNTLMMVKS